ESITIVRSQTPSATPSAAPRWTHVTDVGAVSIFENNRALPRAWLVAGERVATEQQQLQIIRSGRISAETKWEPTTEALVERATGVSFPPGKPRPGTVDIVRRERNSVDITTEADSPSLLVLADNYYPGWQAEVDGRVRPILRANYNQQAVALPPGKH